MITVGISEIKSRLSAYIDKAKAGETVVITDRGRPVAHLTAAAGESTADTEGRLARLERAGVIRRSSHPSPSEVILRPPPRVKRGVDVVQMVIEERASDR